MGSNGEAVSLKEAEKLELVRNVRRMAKPVSKIIAGLGMPSEYLISQLSRIFPFSLWRNDFGF